MLTNTNLDYISFYTCHLFEGNILTDLFIINIEKSVIKKMKNFCIPSFSRTLCWLKDRSNSSQIAALSLFRIHILSSLMPVRYFCQPAHLRMRLVTIAVKSLHFRKSFFERHLAKNLHASLPCWEGHICFGLL